MKVKEIMTKNVITAGPEDSIKDVILKIRYHKVSGLPIVNDKNEVLGVFSEGTIMGQMPDILNESAKIPLLDVKEITSAPVKSAMTMGVVTITEESSIKEAANIFLEKHIHRLPVVGERRKLLGIVTLGDVLKAVVDSDFCG